MAVLLEIAEETSTSPGLPRGLDCCRLHTFKMLLVLFDVKRQVALVQLSQRSVGWIKVVPINEKPPGPGPHTTHSMPVPVCLNASCRKL